MLLLLSLILEVLLIVAFGEFGFGWSGLVLTLFVYGISVVLATRMMLSEYRLTQYGLEKYRDRRMIFSVDMIAYATSMLGVVMRAGAPNYGDIYEQAGFILSGAAFLLLAGSLVWAIVDYFRSRDRFMLVVALTFTWISMVGSFALLLQPPAS